MHWSALWNSSQWSELAVFVVSVSNNWKIWIAASFSFLNHGKIDISLISSRIWFDSISALSRTPLFHFPAFHPFESLLRSRSSLLWHLRTDLLRIGTPKPTGHRSNSSGIGIGAHLLCVDKNWWKWFFKAMKKIFSVRWQCYQHLFSWLKSLKKILKVRKKSSKNEKI